MQKKAVSIVIRGRVQGVGFRYFAAYKASEYNICGWVKNTPQGNVEIEAEGETGNVDTFISWMKIGPSRAIIVASTDSEIPAAGYKNFVIR